MNNPYVPVVVRVSNNNSQENIITLPKYIFYEIRSYHEVELKAGASKFDVICHPNNTENILELPKELIEEFGLFPGRRVNLFIRKDKICLGPLIGIFISNGQVKKANMQNPNFRFTETARANDEANAVVYYFSIKDVDFPQRKIIGTYFNYDTKRWGKKSFPYPDVLYDRGGGTLKSQQEISSYIREELGKSRGLKRVNPKYFFDKWEVHTNMMRYKEMDMYVPKTVMFTEEEDLKGMLAKNSALYIKDIAGNNGKGVARIIKLSDSEYELSHFYEGTLKYKVNSQEELLEKIKEIFKDKKVIIQSAIDVLQINGRNADMRATVQRNGKGKVSITALPVRLGKEGCPITTTRSGATVYKFEDFFTKHFGYSDEEVRNLRERVSDFLLKCFLVIEDIYGEFGEIGIDYAIDKDLRIWFIECNAKPGKDTLYLSYDDDTIKRAFLNPLEYAKYLWSDLLNTL